MEMLKDYIDIFEEYLEQVVYDPAFANLYNPVKYTLENKGKRIRPAIVMLAYDAFGDNIKEVLPAALSIEVFHNFTLLHDDIMDDAPTRRGKDSVYKKYGLNAAILSGDAMLIQSYGYLQSYSVGLFKKLMEIVNTNAIKVCEGQQLDMDFETRDNVTIAEYITMIELKTAVLIAGGLKMGALIGGANDEQSEHLYQFGKNIGIAFQLQDDILDTYGDKFKVGKQKGGDILQKKKTYLYLKTMELLEGQAQSDFESLYNSDKENKVIDVTSVFDTVVIKEYAEQVKQAYLDLAYSHLNAVNLDEESIAVFQSFAKYLVERDY